MLSARSLGIKGLGIFRPTLARVVIDCDTEPDQPERLSTLDHHPERTQSGKPRLDLRGP